MKPFKYAIQLKGREKRELRALKRKGKTEARWLDRARIILWADRDRTTIEETARRLDCGRDKVIFWRRRFLEGRAAKQKVLERLHDLPRSGRPPLFSAEEREKVVLATLARHQSAASHVERVVATVGAQSATAPTSRPSGIVVAVVGGGSPATLTPRSSGIVVCTSRDLAEELSQKELDRPISYSTIVRIWEAMEIKPWRWHYWLNSPDPDLIAKSRAICRLYHHPPKDGTLLCLDEKPGIQIVERRARELPVWPGRVARPEFEYVRHGTLDLMAALEVQTGWVYGRCYARHRAVELVEFLDYLDRVLPVSECGVLHLVSDNLKTRTAPETLEWMEAHAGRVVWHFLPTHASWLNQIEIWFSVLQRKSLARGSWCSYAELERHILNFIRTYNRRWAHPYRWTYKGLPLAA